MDESAGYGEFLFHALGKGRCQNVSLVPKPQHFKETLYVFFPMSLSAIVYFSVEVEVIVSGQIFG